MPGQTSDPSIKEPVEPGPGQSSGDSDAFHEGDVAGDLSVENPVNPVELDQEGTPKTGDTVSFYSEEKTWLEARITGVRTGTQHYYNCQRTDNNRRFGLYLIPSHSNVNGVPELWTFVCRA